MTGFVNAIYNYGYYELKIYQEKNKLINQPFKTFTTMKYAPSIAFEEMSGSAKGVTAAKAKGRKYLRTAVMARRPLPPVSQPLRVSLSSSLRVGRT